MMGAFLAEAGPLIWLSIVLGAASLVAAIRYATVGSPMPRRFAVYTAVTGVAAGALDTVAGLKKALAPIGGLPTDERWIYLLGLEESLNSVSAALVFAVFVGIVLSFGGLRFDRQQKPALVRATTES